MNSHYMDRVREAREGLDQARAAVEQWQTYLRETIEEAVAVGEVPAEVARVAGVSRARVSQIAPVRKGAGTRVHAQKDVAAASCVTTPDTTPSLPAPEVATLSGLATTRNRRPYGRETLFHDTRNSADLALILATAMAHGAERVYLTGPAPEDTTGHATRAEAVRAWAMGEPGAGWHVAPRGHYLADPSLPTLRFAHESGAAVTIMRAASWWGETDADAETCRRAWAGLGTLLDRVPAFAGAGLADTPATTGRALWLRTIPEGRHYPVLSDEYRELIATTSGQGRIELRPAPAGGAVEREDFTVMDGRLMYGALTWGMPVGEPTRHGACEPDEKMLRGRGRWRVTATVPADWAHVGLLPHKDGATWEYPDQPGRTFTTWVDGSEAWLARSHGWRLAVHEGITWAEGKPLDAWRDALVEVWQGCQASRDPAAALAAKAVRSVILYALGAFASRSHPVTRFAEPGHEPADLPAGTEVRMVGDKLMWTETPAQSAWTQQLAHPEWSATVWARARVRLLDATGVDGQRVGALHLPPDRVVAFATDALYLAGRPDWADDGKPGRFRCKGTAPGGFTWPGDQAALYALRDRAEAAAE